MQAIPSVQTKETVYATVHIREEAFLSKKLSRLILEGNLKLISNL